MFEPELPDDPTQTPLSGRATAAGDPTDAAPVPSGPGAAGAQPAAGQGPTSAPRLPETDRVTLARKSYDHLLRTRDRALRDAEWQREQVEHAHRWAEQAFAEERRLADRLNRVVAAAASLGVSIQAINAALDLSNRPGRQGDQ